SRDWSSDVCSSDLPSPPFPSDVPPGSGPSAPGRFYFLPFVHIMYRKGVHAMVEETYGTRHDLVMSNRKALEVTGVISVESFDSEEFLLNTDCGFLGIRGQDLHIKSLDLEKGRVAIEGTIHEMSYLDDGSPRADKVKGFFGRLFR